MAQPHAIRLSSVTKDYHVWRRLRRTRRRGIRGVTLAVPKGIIFGMLGLNGAGKTTTMKLLVGLSRPDSGKVEVLGGAAAELSVRSRTAYIPELPYLPLQLSARQLLGFYGAMNGLAGRHLQNRIDAVLEEVGLKPHCREPLAFLSKGMRQRAAMAQALLHGPEVLFADEPMSGIDSEGTREMREVLVRLRDSGVTVILNSHQIAEVERICDRVGVMAEGRLVREGAVGELLALARARLYRITVLAPVRGKGGGWRVEEISAREAELAPALMAQRRRGAKVLQILAQRGSLEEVFLEIVRKNA